MSRACAWLLAASLVAGCSGPAKPPNPTFTDNAGSEAGPRSFCCENRERPVEQLDAAVEASAVERSVETVIAEERFVAAAGCAREVRTKKALEKSLAELSRSCAPGMSPLSDLVRASIAAGESIETTFSLTSGAICLRVGAVASSGSLVVSLLNPRGESLLSVRSSTAVDLLPGDGPICVREPGSYRATARLVSSGTEVADVAVQVWNVGRDR